MTLFQSSAMSKLKKFFFVILTEINKKMVIRFESSKHLKAATSFFATPRGDLNSRENIYCHGYQTDYVISCCSKSVFLGDKQ